MHGSMNIIKKCQISFRNFHLIVDSTVDVKRPINTASKKSRFIKKLKLHLKITQLNSGSGFNSKEDEVNIFLCLDSHRLVGDKGVYRVKVRSITNYACFRHTCPSTRNNCNCKIM